MTVFYTSTENSVDTFLLTVSNDSGVH